MAETATVKEPEKSLLQRVGRVGNLLNQGVESMVYGTLSLPALVADGYLNIYRTGREALGGEAFQESNLYTRSKQNLTDWGRKMDGSYGKVVGAQTATEQKIVFGAELVTGLVGPGAIKSLKTLTEGKAAFNAVAPAAAAKPAATATASAEAATATNTTTKATQAADGTIDWVAPTLSPEAKAAATKMAADRVAREAAAARGATTTAETAATATNTVAKAEYGQARVLTILAREKSLSGRLEALSGHGPQAEAMMERIISRARASGVSGAEWNNIKNSRTLAPEVIEKVGKIYDARLSALPLIGGGLQTIKGTFSHWASYPGEFALRTAAIPLSVPFSTAGYLLRNHTGKTLAGAAVLGTYLGVDAMGSAQASPADKPAASGAQQKPAAASAAKTEREVPLTETAARKATEMAIGISKLTATSALAMALNLASKLPVLGDAALNGARGSAQALISEIADGEKDIGKAWEKSQAKLQQILPGVHLNALGEFVKGKGVEDMSEEARAHVSDALTALTQPGSPKARAFRETAVAEAKEKAEAAARLAGLGGVVGGSSGSDNADGEDAEDDGISDYVKNYLAGMMGISPDKLNAANVARVGKEVVQDLSAQVGPEAAAAAVAVGGIAAAKTKGGIARKAVVGTLSSIATIMMLQVFGPLLAALAPMLKDLFGGVMAKIGQRFDPQTTAGRFNTESHAIVQRDRDPSATTPAPKAPAQEAAAAAPAGTATAPAKPAATTGEDGIMALLRQNGHDVTQSGTTPAPVPAARVPAQKLEQAVPA